MVMIGTPINLKDYIRVDYELGSKIQEKSIFPIWRDDNFMYFERIDDIFDYIRKEITDEGIN